MKKSAFVSLIALGLVIAIPANARLSSNRLSSNGVMLQGFEQTILSVQSVTLADGTVIALH